MNDHFGISIMHEVASFKPDRLVTLEKSLLFGKNGVAVSTTPIHPIVALWLAAYSFPALKTASLYRVYVCDNCRLCKSFIISYCNHSVLFIVKFFCEGQHL